MSSISAGTTSGTALVSTGDTSGELVLKTNGSTTAVTIDTSQNVGIGTSSPATPLHIYTASNRTNLRIASGLSSGEVATVQFYGTDSGAAAQAYAQIVGVITTNTAGSEAGYLAFETTSSGGVSERVRITSDGYLRMASGTGGIQFGGDTAAANALDDYEEGTWTPTAYGGSSAGTTTYGTVYGTYTKIGRQVTVTFNIPVTSMTGTGTLIFGGLPFNSSNHVYIGPAMLKNVDWPNSGSPVFFLGESRSYFYIYISQDNGDWNVCATDNDFNVFGTMTYFTS